MDHVDTKFGHTSFVTVTESKVTLSSVLSFQPKPRKSFKIKMEKYLVITVTQKNVVQLVFHFKKLMLSGDIESNPGPTYSSENDRHFPAVVDYNSSMDLQLKLNSLIYKKKCARVKHYQENKVKYPQIVGSKFNGSKVTLMKFRNSLFLKNATVNKCQKFQLEKCLALEVSYSLKHDTLNYSGVTFRSDGQRKKFLRTSSNSEIDDYYVNKRIETEEIECTFPWNVTNKSNT